jgi:hypothetical protein
MTTTSFFIVEIQQTLFFLSQLETKNNKNKPLYQNEIFQNLCYVIHVCCVFILVFSLLISLFYNNLKLFTFLIRFNRLKTKSEDQNEK